MGIVQGFQPVESIIVLSHSAFVGFIVLYIREDAAESAKSGH